MSTLDLRRELSDSIDWNSRNINVPSIDITSFLVVHVLWSKYCLYNLGSSFLIF
jgi:hypothetical protein